MGREMKVFTFILAGIGVISSLCCVWFFVEMEAATARSKELEQTLGLENTFLKNRLEEVTIQLDQFQQKIDSLRQQNAKIIQEKVEITSELNVALNVQEEFQTKIEKMESEKKSLQEKITELENVRNSLQTQLETQKNTDQELAQASSYLQQLEQENQRLKEELEIQQKLARAKPAFEKEDTQKQAMVELPPIIVGADLPLLNPAPIAEIPQFFSSSPAPGMKIASGVPSIPDGRILSVNEPNQFVVISLGEKEGVKRGTQFKVLRGDQEVGLIEVIETRPHIAAADIKERHIARFQTDDRILLGQR